MSRVVHSLPLLLTHPSYLGAGPAFHSRTDFFRCTLFSYAAVLLAKARINGEVHTGDTKAINYFATLLRFSARKSSLTLSLSNLIIIFSGKRRARRRWRLALAAASVHPATKQQQKLFFCQSFTFQCLGCKSMPVETLTVLPRKTFLTLFSGRKPKCLFFGLFCRLLSSAVRNFCAISVRHFPFWLHANVLN